MPGSFGIRLFLAQSPLGHRLSVERDVKQHDTFTDSTREAWHETVINLPAKMQLFVRAMVIEGHEKGKEISPSNELLRND